ncbi:APC family permease [Candidatus Halobonum tyrrellensis]|uniref:Amino acid permease-associated protein n=1 Tax=Candidatus Halobonum tyrrellensis G22 TaxID=1324957 RepID=V4HBM1_9EURY|nr:APC family permease [Candidatus Halobonum tyrrellensis]ESP87443.1 amino acid permease-associated protein [Candidatus Halobonum tyrrellensis G22]
MSETGAGRANDPNASDGADGANGADEADGADDGGGFGVATAVALGVGGIVGGGIYAAIGIVVMASGLLTWFSYALATLVVFCCAYSYVQMNAITDSQGGSVAFIEEVTGRTTVAAVIGWTLAVGYVGTMAMYAYAFGAYGQMLVGVEYVWGLPFRPFLSVGIVAVFVALNIAGAGASGAAERYLVFVQAGIIAAFGVVGLWFGLRTGQLQSGLSEFGISPVVGASVGFVSFEGWQLLFYDQGQFADPQETLERGVFVSIPVAAAIYVLVGFVVTSLLPVAVVTAQPEAALLYGSLEISAWLALAVGVSGLVATASAINSTLLSEAMFAKRLVSEGILPERMAADVDADPGGAGDDGANGAESDDAGDDGDEGDSADAGEETPTRAILVIGGLTAAFAVLGSLEAVVEFASLAFIAVFGTVSGLAVLERSEGDYSVVPPLVGVVGSAAFFVMLLWFLYSRLPHVFYLVFAIAAVVFAVEGLYFERESIAEGIQRVERNA